MDTELEFEIVRVKAKEGRRRRHALGPDDMSYFSGNETGLEEREEKENAAPCLRTKTKTRLERLGVLYGDGEVSSPIHKSNEHWLDDGEPGEEEPKKDKYSEERAQRLRALASTINSWEDDLRHISPKKEEPDRYDRFGNKIGSKAVKHETVTPAGGSKANTGLQSPSPTRKVIWDKRIINSLEMQGFKRCDSEEHLVYDYVSPGSKECLSPQKGVKQTRPPNALPPKKMLLREDITTGKPQATQLAKPQLRNPSAPRKVLEEIPLRKVVNDDVSRGVFSERREPLVRQPSPVRQSSPVRQLSPVRQPSPVRHPSPIRQPSPVRQLSPVRQPLPARQPSPVRSPVRKASSPQKSAVREMAAQFEVTAQPAGANAISSRKDPALLSVAEKRAVFEKNAGFVPIPQAPLAQAPPAPVHQMRERSPVRRLDLMAPRDGGSDSPIRHNVNQAVIERFKEIEALRHRWDRNKALTNQNEEILPEKSVTPIEKSQPSSVETPVTPRSIPIPPPMPHSVFSPSTHVAHSLPADSTPPLQQTSPKIRMGTRSPVRSAPESSPPMRLPPRVLSIKEKSPKRDFPYPVVKRIKVSPPKKGHIYPSVSDIETESEVPESDLDPIEEEGSDTEDYQQGNTSLGLSSELDSSAGSLGQQIVRQASRTNLKRPSTHPLDSSDLRSSSSSYTESESRVLQEMDDLLDEAMSSMPSPPKRIRGSSSDSDDYGACSSASFEYSSSDCAARQLQPTTPLLHTVSVYRKQQNQVITPTVRREVRNSEEYRAPPPLEDHASEEELILARIKELQTEIQKQLETISQSSKALNLCLSTPGFSGSPAELEAQKLLLVANTRWNAMSQEVERLKVERKLKPGLTGGQMERGDISLRQISLPLKSFQVSSGGSPSVVVLVKSGPTVLTTELLTLDKKSIKDGRLTFQKSLTLKGLYSDFTASLEVYGYSMKKNDFLHPDPKARTPGKKDKRATPKKQKDKGFLPVESPAGPNAVRSSAFQLWGFAVFSLREVNRNSFTLNKVPYTSPLEGSVELSMASSMQSQVEHAGFLTKFEDVSGFGAWKRRWAVLRGSSVAFWTYPEQYTEGKVPLDTIDLAQVTSTAAELAPNERCARPHTILLESKVRDPSIPESLVATRAGDYTIVTHLLSADTKEERLQWCEQLNKVLHLLRAWKVNRNI